MCSNKITQFATCLNGDNMSKQYSTRDERLLYPEKPYMREEDERAFVREDEITSDIVERAIAMKNLYGSAYAARYLRERGIEQDVINRVLSEGNRRRVS